MSFHDAQIDDARHTVAVARSAAGLGAHILTRTRVLDLLRDGDAVVGVRVRDEEDGEEYDIRSRVVVVAVGIWTDDILRLADPDAPDRVRQSKGVHLVVRGDAFRSTSAVIARTPSSVLFMLPWVGNWLIGTTDTPYEGDDLADPVATEDEISYLLGQANRWLARPLRRTDVIATYAGFRPLIAEGDSEDPTAELSREHVVFRPHPGIVAIAGGKYTTYRVMAADAVNAAVDDLGDSEIPSSTTDQIPLVGAIGFPDVWADRASLAERWGLSLDQTERLLRRHGSRVSEVFDLIADDPSLAQPLVAGHPYLRAEALVAVTHQGARSLSDVLVRRLRITPESVDGGRAAAEAALPLIAGPLGWDAARADKELEAYLSHGMQHAPAS